MSEAVWESEGESQIEEERGKREGSKSGPGDRVLTNLQGVAGLYQCARVQRSDHGASALPGTLCHAGTDPSLGKRGGPVPRPERHGTHRTGREVSRSVRLEPFFGRSRHLVTWHISPLRRGKGGFFCCARDKPRAFRDEQHVYDHLLWPGQLSAARRSNTDHAVKRARLSPHLAFFSGSFPPLYATLALGAHNFIRVTFYWFPVPDRVVCATSMPRISNHEDTPLLSAQLMLCVIGTMSRHAVYTNEHQRGHICHVCFIGLPPNLRSRCAARARLIH